MAERHDTSGAGVMHRATDAVLLAGKLIGALGAILTVLMMLWASALGPGIQSGLQGFLGITDLSKRLVFVEQNMPAPQVTVWDYAEQRGDCTSEICLYDLAAHRTEYGVGCGRPDVTPQVRIKGQLPREVGFHNIEKTRLTRDPKHFVVNLNIGQTIPPGAHHWRAILLYPTCPGRNEPIPRETPWFPLVVSE